MDEIKTISENKRNEDEPEEGEIQDDSCLEDVSSGEELQPRDRTNTEGYGRHKYSVPHIANSTNFPINFKSSAHVVKRSVKYHSDNTSLGRFNLKYKDTSSSVYPLYKKKSTDSLPAKSDITINGSFDTLLKDYKSVKHSYKDEDKVQEKENRHNVRDNAKFVKKCHKKRKLVLSPEPTVASDSDSDRCSRKRKHNKIRRKVEYVARKHHSSRHLRKYSSSTDSSEDSNASKKLGTITKGPAVNTVNAVADDIQENSLKRRLENMLSITFGTKKNELKECIDSQNQAVNDCLEKQIACVKWPTDTLSEVDVDIKENVGNEIEVITTEDPTTSTKEPEVIIIDDSENESQEKDTLKSEITSTDIENIPEFKVDAVRHKSDQIKENAMEMKDVDMVGKNRTTESSCGEEVVTPVVESNTHETNEEDDLDCLRRIALESKRQKDDIVPVPMSIEGQEDIAPVLARTSEEKEVMQLRLIALHSAVMKKHMARKQKGFQKKCKASTSEKQLLDSSLASIVLPLDITSEINLETPNGSNKEDEILHCQLSSLSNNNKSAPISNLEPNLCKDGNSLIPSELPTNFDTAMPNSFPLCCAGAPSSMLKPSTNQVEVGATERDETTSLVDMDLADTDEEKECEGQVEEMHRGEKIDTDIWPPLPSSTLTPILDCRYPEFYNADLLYSMPSVVSYNNSGTNYPNSLNYSSQSVSVNLFGNQPLKFSHCEYSNSASSQTVPDVFGMPPLPYIADSQPSGADSQPSGADSQPSGADSQPSGAESTMPTNTSLQDPSSHLSDVHQKNNLERPNLKAVPIFMSSLLPVKNYTNVPFSEIITNIESQTLKASEPCQDDKCVSKASNDCSIGSCQELTPSSTFVQELFEDQPVSECVSEQEMDLASMIVLDETGYCSSSESSPVMCDIPTSAVPSDIAKDVTSCDIVKDVTSRDITKYVTSHDITKDVTCLDVTKDVAYCEETNSTNHDLSKDAFSYYGTEDTSNSNLIPSNYYVTANIGNFYIPGDKYNYDINYFAPEEASNYYLNEDPSNYCTSGDPSNYYEGTHKSNHIIDDEDEELLRAQVLSSLTNRTYGVSSCDVEQHNMTTAFLNSKVLSPVGDLSRITSNQSAQNGSLQLSSNYGCAKEKYLKIQEKEGEPRLGKGCSTITIKNDIRRRQITKTTFRSKKKALHATAKKVHAGIKVNEIGPQTAFNKKCSVSPSLQVTIPTKAANNVSCQRKVEQVTKDVGSLKPSKRFVICLGDDSDSGDDDKTMKLASNHPVVPAQVTPIVTSTPELEKSVDLLLKSVRSDVEKKMITKEPPTMAATTPLAVRRLPNAQLEEYRRLKEQIVELQKQQVQRLQVINNKMAVTKSSIAPPTQTSFQELSPRRISIANAYKLRKHNSYTKHHLSATNNSKTFVKKLESSNSKNLKQFLVKNKALSCKNITPVKMNVTNNLGKYNSLGNDSTKSKSQAIVSVVTKCKELSKAQLNPAKFASLGVPESINNKSIECSQNMLSLTALKGSSTTMKVVSSEVNTAKQASQHSELPLNMPVLPDNRVQLISLSQNAAQNNDVGQIEGNNICELNSSINDSNEVNCEDRNLEKVGQTDELVKLQYQEVKVKSDQVHPNNLIRVEVDKTLLPSQNVTKPQDVKPEKQMHLNVENKISTDKDNNCIDKSANPKGVVVPTNSQVTASEFSLEEVENNLLAQRLHVVEELVNMTAQLDKMQAGYLKERECVLEVDRLRRDLQVAEQELQQQRQTIASVQETMTKLYTRIGKGRSLCITLAETCYAWGNSHVGSHYRIPTKWAESIKVKLHKVADQTRKLAKLREGTGSDVEGKETSLPSQNVDQNRKLNESVTNFNNIEKNSKSSRVLSAATNTDPLPVKHDMSVGNVPLGDDPVTESPSQVIPSESVRRQTAAWSRSLVCDVDADKCSSMSDEYYYMKENSDPGFGRVSSAISCLSSDKFRSCVLEEYKSPLDHMLPKDGGTYGSVDALDPLHVICPFELLGSCQDEECMYQHLGKHSLK